MIKSRIVRWVGYVAYVAKMRDARKFWFWKVRRKGLYRVIDVEGRIILKQMLMKSSSLVWIECSWLRTVSIGGILWSRWWVLRVSWTVYNFSGQSKDKCPELYHNDTNILWCVVEVLCLRIFSWKKKSLLLDSFGGFLIFLLAKLRVIILTT
jgi:hypothetical protein